MNPNPVKIILKERIAEAVPEFGARVWIEHERVIKQSDLPACVIRFTDASWNGESWPDWECRFSVDVLSVAPAKSDPEAQAETLMDAVIRALRKAAYIGEREIVFDRIGVDYDASGDFVVRRLSLSLSVWIGTLTDHSGLDDFATAAVDIDMASPRNDPQTPPRPDGQIDARVKIHLPTLESA